MRDSLALHFFSRKSPRVPSGVLTSTVTFGAKTFTASGIVAMPDTTSSARLAILVSSVCVSSVALATAKTGSQIHDSRHKP